MFESLKAKLEKKIESLEEDMKWGLEHSMSSGRFDRLSTTKSCYQTFLSMLENEAKVLEDPDSISRLTTIDAIVNTVSKVGDHDNSEAARYGATFRQHEIIDIIQTLPTVQPKRKKGKWIRKPDPYGFFDDIPVCSECGCTTKMREESKFCPNCGADMKGKEA